MHESEKTHQQMLPQSAALESTSADNREGKDETGRGRRGDPATVVQHGRGETGETRRNSVEPDSSGETEDRSLAAPPAVVAVPVVVAQRVAVLDKHGHPLMPCSPARARKLLHSGRARVHHLAPFVIRLVGRTVEESEVPGVEMGIDPGSKFTGVSIFRVDRVDRVDHVDHVNHVNGGGVRHGLIAVELAHRGQLIHKHMGQRSAYRRRRRSANLRYRKPRWANRHPEACANCGKNAKHGSRYCRPCTQTRSYVDNGYRRHRLPPSLQHRIDTTMSAVSRLRRWVPVVAIHQELVRFDMQKIQNPEITGVEYQQGTLEGYEVREYLLEKWGRECAYCDVEDVALQVEHILAKSRGGTNRVSNLTLACEPCNKTKDSQLVQVFLAHDPARLTKILAQAKAPLTDAAAVNATRWALWRELVGTGLPVETGSGGRTKWNRSRFSVPKSHVLDALCAGEVGGVASYPGTVLTAAAMGRGSYARTRPDKYGFPRLHLPRTKVHHGFATGDLVRAVVPCGKKAGTYVGRVAVRSRPSFYVSGVGDVHPKYLRLLQRSDGWNWGIVEERMPLLLPALTDGVPAAG